jgi:hypothetical protein
MKNAEKASPVGYYISYLPIILNFAYYFWQQC